MVTENIEQNMEQPKETYRFLNDCAEIAEKIKNNSLFSTSQVTVNILTKDYQDLLKEIEKFVRIRVDRKQDQISITVKQLLNVLTL